jgi:polyphosphate kinase
VLVHHPYESFEDSVEDFIAAAAADPATVAVKMTAHRIGDDTPFVQSLVKAAGSGKQVACVIEIKARFKEAASGCFSTNFSRARILLPAHISQPEDGPSPAPWRAPARRLKSGPDSCRSLR